MRTKKRITKFAKEIRNQHKIPFTMSIQLSKALLRMDFTMLKQLRFHTEPRIITYAGPDYGTVIGTWLINDELSLKIDFNQLKNLLRTAYH